MEQQFKTTANHSVSLEVLINNLVRHSLPMAHQHNTSIENEVAKGVVLAAGMHKAIPVMRDLLNTVVSNSRNGDIHISADRHKDQVILEIQERNNYNGYALAYSIDSLAPEAASAGGYISINGPRQKVVTISFTFPYAA